jgi:hypothetical protein
MDDRQQERADPIFCVHTWRSYPVRNYRKEMMCEVCIITAALAALALGMLAFI